jgi:hypothetical protein
MHLMRKTVTFVFAASLVALTGCASKSNLQPYATKAEVESLRSELMHEIGKTQVIATSADASASSSAAAAQQAADSAKIAADKADAIFRKSLRK